MDPFTFWTVITLLTSSCGGGFIYLSHISNRNRINLEAMNIQIANRPTYKDVADDYVRKEVNELQFKAIEKDMQLILDKLDIMQKKNNNE